LAVADKGRRRRSILYSLIVAIASKNKEENDQFSVDWYDWGDE
jgi:hypothetical protein